VEEEGKKSQTCIQAGGDDSFGGRREEEIVPCLRAAS
jgi:hypothetical protein